MDWLHGEVTVSTDPQRLDMPLIHRFLSEDSYWARGVPRAVVEKSVRHSLCFGVYRHDRQIGFARVVTDFAVFGHLMDVFIVPEERGKGLSKLLLGCIMAHPELQGFRLWQLGTKDAHGLYTQFGFRPLAEPERSMEIRDAEVYSRVSGRRTAGSGT